jgi:hypothetical protein
MSQENKKSEEDNVETLKSSVKLPPFWVKAPEAWFIQVEAQFDVCRVTSESRRYSHLLMSLPQELIEKTIDIIQTPPEENPYTFLKTKLIERLTVSEEKKISDLLYHTEMGDRSPSDFYRHMVHLAGNSTEMQKTLVRKLWMNRLPKSLELSLIPLDTKDINEVLKLADRIWEATTASVSSVGSLKTGSSNTSASDEVSELRKEISELKNMFQKFSTGNRGRFQQRSFNRNRSRSRGRSKDNSWCTYHQRFKNKAKNCTPPCSFKPKPSDQKN